MWSILQCSVMLPVLPALGVEKWLIEKLNLKSSFSKLHEADAGTANFEKMTPQKLWQIKCMLGNYLSSVSPPYKRSLIKKEKYVKNESKLPNIGYVNPSPQVPRHVPDCESFSPH